MIVSKGQVLQRTSSPLLVIRGLYKSYGKEPNKVDVLKGVDFKVDRGETVAVVGASGVGKSTLLGIMGALERPTEGEVLYDDKPVSTLDDAMLAEHRNSKVGFVFQSHHLLPEFTAVENVMLPALIGGVARGEAMALAAELLGEVGLSERLHHKPGELSGGEQQRVAITRALVRSPEVVLADEPTGNLDAKTGDEVFELMLALNRDRGVTLVVVTHNETLAAKMSRTVLMKDGILIESGKSGES